MNILTQNGADVHIEYDEASHPPVDIKTLPASYWKNETVPFERKFAIIEALEGRYVRTPDGNYYLVTNGAIHNGYATCRLINYEVGQLEAMLKHSRGRRICAWCGADLGPALTEDDSHTICEDCKREIESAMPEDIPYEGEPIWADGRETSEVDDYALQVPF